MRASSAIRTGELDLEDWVAAVIARWRPAGAGPPRGTDGLLSLPVDGQAARGEAFGFLRLPMIIDPCRAQQIDIVLATAGHQELSVDVAGVDQVDARQQICRGEGTVNRIHGVAISRRCRCCLAVRDQVWPVVVASFCKMHLSPPKRYRASLRNERQGR